MSNSSQQFLKHLCFSYSQYQVFVDYTEYSAQNNCDESIIFKNSEGKTYTARPLKQKSFYSLSKWSNYPFFIFLCPKIVSVKKTKHLELSDTSLTQPNFLGQFKYILKKIINNYAFEKTKHLELSDSFLEHSQIF